MIVSVANHTASATIRVPHNGDPDVAWRVLECWLKHYGPGERQK